MTYPFYFIFALAPSIIWLLFFLRKDVHPESNRMILKIFFFGMLSAIPAALIEIGIFKELDKLIPFLQQGSGLNLPPILISILYIFIGIALVEEVLKYLVVRDKVLKDPEFDEPLDAVLYMIIAALGFAALENILILSRLGPSFLLAEVFSISILRFLGATFLHALCSGTIGFFIALSFFETKKRSGLLAVGLGIAILLHGLYNFSILELEGNAQSIIPVIILVSLAIFVSLGFKRLEKLASVCKIK